MKDLIRVSYVGTIRYDRMGNAFREIFFDTYFEEEPKYKQPILQASSNYWQHTNETLIPKEIFDSQVGDIWTGKIVSRRYRSPISGTENTITLPVIGDTQDPENFEGIADAVFAKKAKGMMKVSRAVVATLRDIEEEAKPNPNIIETPKNPPMPLFGKIWTDEDED